MPIRLLITSLQSRAQRKQRDGNANKRLQLLAALLQRAANNDQLTFWKLREILFQERRNRARGDRRPAMIGRGDRARNAPTALERAPPPNGFDSSRDGAARAHQT